MLACRQCTTLLMNNLLSDIYYAREIRVFGVGFQNMRPRQAIIRLQVSNVSSKVSENDSESVLIYKKKWMVSLNYILESFSK